MIRMKRFWLLSCVLLFATGVVLGQGTSFCFLWSDQESPNWFELDYCETGDGAGVVLQDGTVIRLMRDIDLSGFSDLSYSLADTICTVGQAGSLGEVWPTNEFLFNSASIPRATGSFLTEYIQYVGDTPGFQPVYLLVGCYEVDGEDSTFVPMWSTCDFNITGNTQIIIECPNGGLFSQPCWTRIGCCELPPPCDPAPPVTGFEASDSDCDSIRMTWDAYDSTMAAALGYDCIDSLIIGRNNTKIASLPWWATSFIYFPPNVETVYSFTIRVKRCCSNFVLSDAASDVGIRPRTPTGIPVLQDASIGICDSVVCLYDMPALIQSWDSTALLRNGVVVAFALKGASGQTGLRIVHHNAPMGFATYAVAGWNQSCGIGTQSNSLPGEAIVAPAEVQNVRASDSDCVHPTYVLITWNDLNQNETGYRVYRDGIRIAQVGANTTSYNNYQGSPAPAQGVTYAYTVRAYNSCDSSHTATPDNGTLPILPPQVQNMAASDTLCDGIRITWDDLTGETGYAVIKSSPAPAETVYVGPNTTEYNIFDTFGMTSIVPLTSYTFKVVAGNPCGFGTASVTNTGTRQRKPNPVTNLVAGTSTCAYARITWSQSSTNEKGFKLFRDAVEIDTANVNAVSYNDSSATPGVGHTYTVFAYNQCGDTTSPTGVLATRLTPLSAPANFNATDALCGTVTCSWTDLTNETGYKVNRDDGARAIVSFNVAANATSYNDATAQAGTIYSYWVTGINSCGEGTASTADDGALLPLPGQPVFNYDYSDCNTIELCWEYLDDVDSVEILCDGQRLGMALSPLLCLLFEPLDSLEHGYQAVAYNGCGPGDTSATIFTSRLSIPNAVDGLSATDSLCDVTICEWLTVAMADTYQVYRNDIYIGYCLAPDTVFYDSTASHDTFCDYYVKASNTCGTGAPSVVDEGRQYKTPVSPSSLTVSDDLCTGILCEWDGTPYSISYWLYRSDGEELDSFAIAGSDTFYIDTSATPYINYTYWIASEGFCEISEVGGTDTGSSGHVPSYITGVAIDEFSCDSVIVTWDDIVNEYGYLIKRNGSLIDFVGANVTTFIDYPDSGGFTYRIQAFNECGASPDSDPAYTTMYRPPVLDSLEVAFVDCEVISLEWVNTESIEWINIYRDYTIIDSLPAGATTYLDYQPEPGLHSYFVQPMNACKTGETSDTLTVALLVYPQPPDTLITSDNGCDAIYLAWTSAIGVYDWYIVYRDSMIVDTLPFADTSYVDTNVISNITYNYDVSALSDICGMSELYGSTGFSIVLLEPPAPPEIVVNTDGVNAYVRWEPVEENISGCPVQAAGYIISFAEESDGPFWYLTYTTDTSFVHADAVTWAENMFYQVDTYVGLARAFAEINMKADRSRISLKDVQERVRR